MTIVLGKRPARIQTNLEHSREARIRHFVEGIPAESVAEAMTAPYEPAPGSPRPVPVSEIRGIERGIYVGARRRRAVPADGQVGLYASRLDAQAARRLSSVEQPVHLTLKSVGRGSKEHYQSLYPSRNVQLPDISFDISIDVEAHKQRLLQVVRGLNPMPFLRLLIAGLSLSHSHRLSNSRRALMASMAAIVLLAGMATSTLAAQQMRYEVQPGDTLESVAAEFGVDPEAIYRSSWMPNGYTLEAGQVIIIPEPGQSPSEAAIMAAERQGTSPWVMGAHEVVWGDTVGDIAELWGVPVSHLLAFNPDIDPSNLIVGERIMIPWERDSDAARPQATSSSDPLVMLPVPLMYQTRNLSCEYAATSAATMVFAGGVNEQTFINSVPLAKNPHLGYRGNIDGAWGNTTDYGVYAGPLQPVLDAHGFNSEAFYSMGDVTILKQHLDAGRPVVVWLGFWGDTRERLSDEGDYSVFSGMHVVTAMGYDANGVYVMDPAKGQVNYYDWATFSAMWRIVDGMGLAIWPK